MSKFTKILLDDDKAAKLLLFTSTMRNQPHSKVFGNLDRVKSFELFENRLLLLKKLCLSEDPFKLTYPFPDIKSLDFIWNYVLCITQKIVQTPITVCGIAGPPGSGKSTLAKAILMSIFVNNPATKSLAISLDDFYFSKSERERLGIRWRAQPGSHDIEQAVSFLDVIKSKKDKVTTPHFNHAIDDCNPSEVKEGPIDFLIFEGWFVGMRNQGYEKIASHLDYLIYLDCSAGFSKMRRFSREERIRFQSEGQKGMPLKDLDHFWNEVLYPGISKWVLPVRSNANLIINVEAFN